jgi:hypothetical protein
VVDFGPQNIDTSIRAYERGSLRDKMDLAA